MVRRPCSKCGTTEYPKYTRLKLRRLGNRTPMMASYCILCHKEDQKIREERRYKKKLAYNRNWRKENKDKKNAADRRWYQKKKKRSFNPTALVQWHGTTDDLGFSRMTYTPFFLQYHETKEK